MAGAKDMAARKAMSEHQAGDKVRFGGTSRAEARAALGDRQAAGELVQIAHAVLDRQADQAPSASVTGLASAREARHHGMGPAAALLPVGGGRLVNTDAEVLNRALADTAKLRDQAAMYRKAGLEHGGARASDLALELSARSELARRRPYLEQEGLAVAREASKRETLASSAKLASKQAARVAAAAKAVAKPVEAASNEEAAALNDQKLQQVGYLAADGVSDGVRTSLEAARKSAARRREAQDAARLAVGDLTVGQERAQRVADAASGAAKAARDHLSKAISAKGAAGDKATKAAAEAAAKAEDVGSVAVDGLAGIAAEATSAASEQYAKGKGASAASDVTRRLSKSLSAKASSAAKASAGSATAVAKAAEAGTTAAKAASAEVVSATGAKVRKAGRVTRGAKGTGGVPARLTGLVGRGGLAGRSKLAGVRTSALAKPRKSSISGITKAGRRGGKGMTQVMRARRQAKRAAAVAPRVTGVGRVRPRTVAGRIAYYARRMFTAPVRAAKALTSMKALGVVMAVIIAVAPAMGCAALFAAAPAALVPVLTTQSGGVGSLAGVEAQIAAYLLSQGYSKPAIAGILGNLKHESGMNPNVDADDGYGTVSLGLVQMTGGERTSFLAWCSANGKQWNSAATQMEWTFSGEEGTSSYAQRWKHDSFARTYYTLETGYEERFSRDLYTADEFKNATDVDLATFSWMACYERCGSRKSYDDDVSRLNKRLQYAREYYAALCAGTPTAAGQYGSAVDYGLAHLGVPYVWGGPCLDESKGTDCSGWVTRCYYYGSGVDFTKVLGGRPTAAKYCLSDKFETIPGDQVQAGDIEVSMGHVVLCLGDGRICEEPQPGGCSRVVNDYHFGVYRRYVG